MEKTIESILPVVLIFVSSAFCFSWDILAHKGDKNRMVKRIFCLMILFYFVYIFLKVTLIGRECSLQRRVWLIPFYSYYKYLSGWQVYLFKQNIQNILLFMPLGFFLCIFWGGKTKKSYRNVTVGIGLLLSVFVEVTQYIRVIGLFEVDDLIHNTLGTFLGTLVYDIICCMRFEGNAGRGIILKDKPQFLTKVKIIGYVISLYLIVTLVAYANHLYHIYVLWR